MNNCTNITDSPKHFFSNLESGLKRTYFRNLEQRLQRSVYAGQLNDFYFLTIPNGHPSAGLEVPVDYKLVNLIQFFWDNNFITHGWNQGYDNAEDLPWYDPNDTDIVTSEWWAFISFNVKLTTGEHAGELLEKLLVDAFGPKSINKTAKNPRNYIIRHPKRLSLQLENNVIFLFFNKSFIDTMHKILGIEIPDYESMLPGFLTRRAGEYDSLITHG